MSTSTLLETWLNNFQPNLNEKKYLTKAKIAHLSYKHAVELDPSNLTVWTEYGNFVYSVHSYCSRLLKQESDSLSMERFSILESRKDDMLNVAENCFKSAIVAYAANADFDQQDERWLYYYMRAKIAEKKSEEPLVFLELYEKSKKMLYIHKAEFPERLSNSNKSTQHLAIETLEVYYRNHASILKYLEKHEDKPLKKSLGLKLKKYLQECANNPFKNYHLTPNVTKPTNSKSSNKRRESQESTTTNESDDGSSSSSDSSESSDSSSSSESSSQSMSKDEITEIVKLCLSGLEDCVLRFPQHYKSIYRLASHYFTSKTDQNIELCKKLLFGSYDCQFHPGKHFHD